MWGADCITATIGLVVVPAEWCFYTISVCLLNGAVHHISVPAKSTWWFEERKTMTFLPKGSSSKGKSNKV